MAPLTMLLLIGLMVCTSLLSGIFGMAGGMVLIGVLILLLPLPEAMALHAVTQMASNGWRSLLWLKHVRWRIVVAYVVGCAAAITLWSLVRFVPGKPLALIMLGVSPFLLHLLPHRMKPDAESPVQGAAYGVASMSLMLVTGVAGPLLDSFFLGGKLDRRGIIATKAGCQVFGHSMKLLYFGGLIDQAAGVDPWLAAGAVLASMTGTMLAKPVLEKLSDVQFKRWAGRLVTTIASYYIAQGVWLWVWPQ